MARGEGMLLRWVKRAWHWLTDPQPWNRHDPRRYDNRNGLDWPDDE